MDMPIQYLCEKSYRPEWLKDGALESTLENVISQKSELEAIGEELIDVDRYYLIGSGGSYSVQLPIRFIAEKFTSVQVKTYSGWSYLHRNPYCVDEDAACIFISHSGNTKEILDSLNWAKDRGARTVGVSQNPTSDICLNADYHVAYKGEVSTVGKLTSLYTLFGTIFTEGGYTVGDTMLKQVDLLPVILPSMIQEAKNRGKPLGLEYKDFNEMFVLGGGINWGLTYQFATCTLQEMCWIHATPLNLSEFMHGPIELFTEGKCTVFLRGRGDETSLEDKIIRWADGNGVNLIVFDSQGMDLDPLMTPFTLFVELDWFSYYLSLAKNRKMGVWRYYDKVDFY